VINRCGPTRSLWAVKSLEHRRGISPGASKTRPCTKLLATKKQRGGRGFPARPGIAHASSGRLGNGIDPLLMLVLGVDSIRDVILFPQLRPEH